MFTVQDAKEVPPLEVSKWLDLSALLTLQEMEQLFKDLDHPYLVKLGGVVTKETALFSEEAYLELYSQYLAALAAEKPLSLPAVAMTSSLDAFTLCPVSGERCILKQRLPAIEMKEHALFYSELEGKFRSGIFGKGGVQWGVTFSYPTLFVEPSTKEVVQLLKEGAGNSQLFRELQGWMRRSSDPTPIEVAEQKMRLPARIGKEALELARSHPGLKRMGAVVDA